MTPSRNIESASEDGGKWPLNKLDELYRLQNTYPPLVDG